MHTTLISSYTNIPRLVKSTILKTRLLVKCGILIFQKFLTNYSSSRIRLMARKGRGELIISKEPVEFNERGFTIDLKYLPEDAVTMTSTSFIDAQGEEIQVVSVHRLGGHTIQYFSDGRVREITPDGYTYTCEVPRVPRLDDGNLNEYIKNPIKVDFDKIRKDRPFRDEFESQGWLMLGTGGNEGAAAVSLELGNQELQRSANRILENLPFRMVLENLNPPPAVASDKPDLLNKPITLEDDKNKPIK